MEKVLYTKRGLSGIDRIERDKAIVAAFKALRKKYPTSSLEGIFLEIKKESDLTTAAIRAICKKQGVC